MRTNSYALRQVCIKEIEWYLKTCYPNLIVDDYNIDCFEMNKVEGYSPCVKKAVTIPHHNENLEPLYLEFSFVDDDVRNAKVFMMLQNYCDSLM